MPLLRPEKTIIAGSVEVPRMINGLWQLAGGHDKNVDCSIPTEAMDKLSVVTFFKIRDIFD